MRQVRYIEVRPRSGNVFAQVLGLLAGVVVLVVSVVLGAFLLAAILGFALIVAIGLYARFWWLRRQVMRAQDSQYVDAEYRVVSESRRRDREP